MIDELKSLIIDSDESTYLTHEFRVHVNTERYIGRCEGISIGKNEERLNIVINMLIFGMDILTIHNITNVPIDKIRSIKYYLLNRID